MLSSEDHPGLFSVVIGLIVLVFAGLGLSLLADKRFSLGRGEKGMKREIQLAGTEITRMRERVGDLSRHLARLEAKIVADTAAIAAANRRFEEQTKTLETLASTRDELRRSLPQLEREFAEARQADQRSLPPAAGSTRPPAAPTPPAAPPPDLERIQKVQATVRTGISAVGSLSSQLSQAQSAIARGEKSVPGSLETWQARASRLQQSLARARAALDAATAELRELAPGDPLLRR